MRFDLLGPLDVVHDGRPVVLRGATQRAVLAFLLLHHNEVVATSSLLSALWPDGVPATARKMVQNAVSGLRTTLAARSVAGEEQPMLLTHAPGYLLRVGSEQVDVARFRRLVAAGRSAADDETAIAAYREALGLWRGRMLADLAETGVAWPELTALEDERLAVHEELFALELDRGRHHEVLTDLRALAEAHPNRERLNGQLMTALYRCGRHVDALEVFRATRAALAEGLGLEPGKELRELERAILQHDDTLLTHEPAPEPPPRPVVPVLPTPPVTPAPPVIAVAGPRPEPADAERKPVVVVGIVPAETGDDDPEDAVEVLARLRAVAEEEAAAEGAHLPGGPGPVLLAVFGLPGTRDDDAVRAVRTALRIRDRLAAAGVVTQIGVDSGDVLAEPSPGGPVVTGGVLDRCVRSALGAPDGRVRVSDAVREASEPTVVYGAADDSPDWWQAGSVRPHPVAETPDPGTFAGRDHDLDLLGHFLGFVEHGGRPHRVTVLGEPGIGKTRLLAEFGELLAKRPEVRVLEAAGDLAATFAGAPGLLPRTVARLRTGGDDDALRAAATELTAHGPLVVLADDVHKSGRQDAVAGLSGVCAGLPVLVVAAARPSLPGTSGSPAGQTTVTLAPLADNAVAGLLDVLLPGTTRLARGKRELITRIGGNPRFAHAYADGVRGRTTPFAATATPPLVRRTLAALLDSLPATEKAVLKAATLTGDVFDAADVASVCGRSPEEIAAALTALAERDVLQREEDGFTFRRAVLRELAYQRIPRSVRTELLRRPVGLPARTEITA